MRALSPIAADPVENFLARWHGTERAERANKDLFLTELCDLLGVPRPDPAGPESAGNAYVFERAVPLRHPDGRVTIGHVDLYRRARFVLEAKQEAADARPYAAPDDPDDLPGLALAPAEARAARRADPYGRAMLAAKAQAERYVRHLPPETEPTPLFLIVCDVGHSFEIFADFTQKGRAYHPFPDARSHRVLLPELRSEKIRARLRGIWLDPAALDPARASAEVTRQAARHLAELAKSFEADGHEPRHVAAFLTRCLFCMFAEDVGLLPKEGFRTLLDSLRPTPHGVAATLENLFRELNTGTPFSTVLRVRLLHFNGGLFDRATALPVNPAQLALLIKASALQWRDVEPAIFGTLLERALDPAERHKLGAHYTPRAYVERLVLPTVIEPLRAEWGNVLASTISRAEAGRTARAQEDSFKFHRRLCSLRVLDPACASGNFLYVTLAHFKILEGEVLDAYERFGGGRRTERGPRGIGAETVDPHQFLGIELNPRAASLAELVLWIGYLQWHYQTFGEVAPAEPVLKNFKNIEHRDAVLAHDGPPVAVTRAFVFLKGASAIPGLPKNWLEAGFSPEETAHPKQALTFWDRTSFRADSKSGLQVPDESKRVPFYSYEAPRPAVWPQADFIVGNPPFIGKGRLRDDLGDGYVETLREAYREVPESADLVMYWWHKAARLVLAGKVQRFGFITTNSIKQTFNRRVVRAALDEGLSLRFAIPDHPWVDTADGAAVRIAITVGALAYDLPERDRLQEPPPPDPSRLVGELWVVVAEQAASDEEGGYEVNFAKLQGRIGSTLAIGAELANSLPLRANDKLATTGLILGSRGFVLSAEQATALQKAEPEAAALLFPLRNGEDLTDTPRDAWVIDTDGWTEERLRDRAPQVYQHLLETVKPERLQNRDARLRRLWWLFRRSNEQLRGALKGLPRYIATVETTKHRVFQFLDASIKPEHRLIVTASDDALHLGVLSSRIHVVYALATGGTLEDRPVYNKSRCFDTFPFPALAPQSPLAEKIRSLAEELDAHRKRARAAHGLGLTTIYNVLGKLRVGESFSAKETVIYERALVATLRHLHDELDAAVATAYGWPGRMNAADILTRLVALNATRAAEEAAGKVRWLRPEFQAPAAAAPDLGLTSANAKKSRRSVAAAAPRKSRGKLAWPDERPAQVEAVSAALAAAEGAVTAADLAAVLARAQKETVAEILAALVIIGRAQRGEKRGTFTAG